MRGTLLSAGDEVLLVSSAHRCRVTDFIGSGGQGEVYAVDLNGGGDSSEYALKCYFGSGSTQQQWDALVALLEAGPPDARFLWPIDLVRLPAAGSFGYVMPRRHRRFHGLVEHVSGRVRTTFRALTTAGFGLADSYLRLHSKGLCYRDISYGNVFFDPETGDVLICDNDNVAFDGRGGAGILGTPRFMAPEIVRREALPSTRTDLFSLAVLLFYMFVRWHPLQGARELEHAVLDADVWDELFGWRPLFIFDHDDDSNRPVSGYHDPAPILWPVCPPLLRDLFTKAFTDGIRDPQNGRVAESVWKQSMVRLRDSIGYCGYCGAENFFDVRSARGARPPDVECWNCRRSVAAPYRLEFRRDAVLLNHDTELFGHHLLGVPFDFDRPAGRVERHPSEADLWGLRNVSGEKWVAVGPDGTLHDVLPGRTVRIEHGLRIHFPRAEGAIQW